MTGNRRFYIYVVLFGLGAACTQLDPSRITIWVPISIAALSLPLALVSALRPVVVFLAGAAWALLRADQVLAVQWPGQLEGRDVVVTGKVAGLPERGEHYLGFDLDVERARHGAQAVAFAGRIRVRWYEPPRSARSELEAGTTWRLEVRLKRPHGHYNPGGFDYEGYLFREGIRATGYVRRSGANERLTRGSSLSLAAIRQGLRDRLDAAMKGLHHGGLLRALAIGDRSGISRSEWRTLLATGTSHLMSISGLHIGFVAGVGALLGVWIGRVAGLFSGTVAAPRVGALVGLGFAAIYAALSGFNVPAQRALVMAAVFLLAVWCRRHAWNMRSLCAALMVVLVMNPASVHGAGFWLSFSAVAFILAWAARRRQGAHRDANGRTRGAKAIEAFKLQWMLSLALLPLVALFFGRISTVSAPANMLAVPVVMFAVVPLCLAGTVTVGLGFPGVAAVCLRLADQVLTLLWSVLSRLARLPWSSLALHLDVWQALGLLAGAAWLVLARPGARKWGLACLLVLLIHGPVAPARGEFRLVVLDAGEHLSVVVRTRRHVLVYGTGGALSHGFSPAGSVLMPYLRARSMARVDVLVVPHGGRAASGGVALLRSQVPLGRVLSSAAGSIPGASYCLQGQHWTWDGVKFRILHPALGTSAPGNDSSCVLRIAGRYGSALVTGDIGARAEHSLERRWGRALASDVLLIPHHGSATSSTASFIDMVRPRWAIVSAGYLNRYGHPAAKVMARYRERGIRTMNTATAGAIIARLYRSGISIRGFRDIRPRYWLTRRVPEHSPGTI